MILSQIGTPVETLPGVGPSKAKLFAKLNIFTISDLLQTFPKSYEDRTHRIPLKSFNEVSKIHTICKVMSHEWFGYGNMKTLKIHITDGNTSASLIAFNRPFLQKSLPEGAIISVTGHFEVKYSELQSTSFEAEQIAQTGDLKDFQNIPIPGSGILPVYALTEGLTQKVFHKTIENALKLYGKAIDTELPKEYILERNLLPKNEALLYIHAPKSFRELEQARKTLIYEELFQFEYKMALRALNHRGYLPDFNQIPDNSDFFEKDISNADEPLEISNEDFIKELSPRQKQLAKRLPFNLTLGQKQAILSMNKDVDQSQNECNQLLNNVEKITRNPFSMQRLLQGDVGSGKTLVAFFIALRVVDYGGQCAILAPTELLAKQHAENAASLLEPLSCKVAFLTGNLKAKGRDSLLTALREGNIDIVIGTHALFSQNIRYKKLQFCVIDEQHRFGVAQRESIVEKGRINFGNFSHTPDVLMMSATPIPQTLALTMFGDLDVSTIKTMPEGRKPIKTYLSVMGNERNVYEAVRKQLKEGHQAYFVYPRISEDSTDSDTGTVLKSAEEMFKFFTQQVYPDFKCALIHGKISEEEQNKILSDFKKGLIQVLVATTVVEVGVDVANANCIVVEHADRFGLAELHQIRGRVGRSSLQSYCFLVYSKNITQDGIERMKALHESTDGFKIAEEDLKLRGPGQINGTIQSGYLTLGLADLVRDKELLKIARYDAFTFLKNQQTN